jgi:hypothetical protein
MVSTILGLIFFIPFSKNTQYASSTFNQPLGSSLSATWLSFSILDAGIPLAIGSKEKTVNCKANIIALDVVFEVIRTLKFTCSKNFNVKKYCPERPQELHC